MFKISDKLDTYYFDKLWENKELNQLVTLFKENNFELRIAGGAVRDILMNKEPHDVDFATDATPTEMKKFFIDNNIRLINANGESHGTITPRLNDKENFEITTLRIDKVTDGRRAEVEFTKDWKLDSERRDLTINSMFLDVNGTVYDYFDGYNDLINHIVRFVGNPERRIQEDYLRILRYFRFYGRICQSPNEHLQETLNKIRSNKEGLQRVSGERIWMELKKIFTGNFAPDILSTMKQCEILPFIGLPENLCLKEIYQYHKQLILNDANPALILALLLNNDSEVNNAFQRLKLSKDEYYIIHFIVIYRDKLRQMLQECITKEEILDHFKEEYIMHHGEPSLPKLKMCYGEYFKYIDRLDIWKQFNEWDPPKFPIRGNDLSIKWGLKGKQITMALQFLRKKWQMTKYTATSNELVENESFKSEFFQFH